MPASSQPAAPVPLKPVQEPLPHLVPAPSRRPPSRWRWLALVAGVSVAAGGLWLLLRQNPADKGGTGGASPAPGRAAGGTTARSLRISGQTSARRFATILVPVFAGPDSGSDLVLMKAAKAGALVHKGDLVAEFDPQPLRDHIDDMNDTVHQAENDVEKKRADQQVEWEALQQRLRVAKADLDKARLELKAAEVRTDIERELLKLDSDEAEAAYQEIAKDVASTRISQRAELRMLEITAQRQKVHRGNHTRDLARFTMRAPMDGLVVMLQAWRGGEMRQIQQGDQVYPGQQFMKIVDPNSMQLEASVSQADANRFRVGQTADIGLDAFPDARFRGRVYSIGAIAVKGMWETYYIRNIAVRIAIEGRDARLIPDLSAWAHVRREASPGATQAALSPMSRSVWPIGKLSPAPNQ
ncbi:MAG TPA: efflux RND transporter periplasmic adaptor subunit [Bryobacteraceae bacterium]